MDNRRKRFFGSVAICQPNTPEKVSASEQSNLAGWIFRTETHPFEGSAMAVAETPMSLYGEYDSTNPQIRYDANLFVSAVRLASSTEVSAGFGISLSGSIVDTRHYILDSQNLTGLVHCYETAQATRDTAQIPVKWNFDTGTSKPNVERFRGVPRVTHISETLIFLEQQMTAAWHDGEAPVIEAAISGRTGTLAAGDEMVLSIPWIHGDLEVIAKADLSKLNHAVVKVKELVAP